MSSERTAEMLRSERRTYEGRLKGHDPDVIMYLEDPSGETLLGMKQGAYEELGCPERIAVTVVPVGP